MTTRTDLAQKSLLRRLIDIHDTPRSWLFGLAAFLVAFGLRYGLEDMLPLGYPFLTFFPAVILTAFIGGLWPGIAVSVASGLASWYFFIAPENSFLLPGSTALALGFFIFIVSVDLAVIHLMFKWMQALDAERERSRDLAVSRDLMFKEMQHRISNNLAVVSSLVRMQRNAIEDDAARRALDEAATRLSLVGKIHRQLHDPDGQELPFGVFVRDLCNDLVQASGTERSVTCEVQAEELYLSSEHAVPVGLILTEVVSNALEHAFAGRQDGTVAITLKRDENDHVCLTIADDGRGLPEGFDLTTTRSLGLMVARKFAEQIGAIFEMSSKGGTVTVLRFAHG